MKNITSHLWNVTSAPKFIYLFFVKSCSSVSQPYIIKMGNLTDGGFQYQKLWHTSNIWTETVTLNAGLTFSSICLTGIRGTYFSFNTQFWAHPFNCSHYDRLHSIPIEKWASYSYRTSLNVLRETKEAAAPSETKFKHLSVKPQLVREKQNISTFQSLQRKPELCSSSSSFLYCYRTRAKFSPFDKQNRFCGASVWLWPPLHQRHLSFLEAQPFICYLVHLGDCIPARQQKLMKSEVLLFTSSK